ncbi:DUF115 domain-containing protein [Lacrimispora algidixylanolytica]|uniref:DUF115 domain-containing protein n=1 Tax=Lacrimispora algidixylanolytica TaxID=94868 RepID=A0A419TBI6_9FIRM|nr:DUF115 domain-containing protein [Lacrimispora algidixylanolytica]RKD34830.1 hypothetical protein BET01_00240 [Lacrimispora algidixylanolytica]
MIEKIWPVNKLVKLRQEVTELRQETMLLRRESELLNHQFQQGKQGIEIKFDEKCRSLSEEMQNTKEDILKVLSDSKHETHEDLWMTKFGYDNMISSLQLAVIEQVVPGNYERLSALKNTHAGERCFVIGNGPSLNTADLEILRQNGEFCFASKRINLIFDQTEWRPNIWGASDLDYIEMYQDEIREIKGFPKLICAQSIVRNNIVIEDAVYYPFIQVERQPQWFNEDILRGVHFYGTITCKLINFAVYMGFKEIYLLGVDNTVPIKINEDGKREYDPKAQNHFSGNYFTEKDMVEMNKSVIDIDESVAYVTSAYASVKWFCDQLGVGIFNATRGGTLEVYPRVNFDSIRKR